MSEMERFMAKVEVTEAGCWQWTASLATGGYAQFRGGGTMVRAHRWIWKQLRGPIPEGLDLDHLCRNRSCVNPDHLEPVTRGENLRRGYQHRPMPETCVHGHPWTPETTYRQKKNGGRVCRICRRESIARWKQRQKESHNPEGTK